MWWWWIVIIIIIIIIIWWFFAWGRQPVTAPTGPEAPVVEPGETIESPGQGMQVEPAEPIEQDEGTRTQPTGAVPWLPGHLGQALA
jgi:hypothetical protein